MKTVGRVVTIMAILVGIYLFMQNGTTSVRIIQALGGTVNESIKNLQGR